MIFYIVKSKVTATVTATDTVAVAIILTIGNTR